MSGKWTIDSLLNITSQVALNRFEFAARDVIKSAIHIKKVTVYDGKSIGTSRTKFIAESSSFPQYFPYYTKKDSRGRTRAYQRKYRHTYQCILQVDWLSTKTPCKIRIGSEKEWVKSPPASLIKSKINPYGQYLSVGDYNIVVNSINPDLLFVSEWYRSQEGCLFGRNRTKYPPKSGFGVPILTKHEINFLEVMLNYGIFVTYSKEDLKK